MCLQHSTATLAESRLRSCRLACQHDGVVDLVALQVGQDVAAALAVACRRCGDAKQNEQTDAETTVNSLLWQALCIADDFGKSATWASHHPTGQPMASRTCRQN